MIIIIILVRLVNNSVKFKDIYDPGLCKYFFVDILISTPCLTEIYVCRYLLLLERTRCEGWAVARCGGWRGAVRQSSRPDQHLHSRHTAAGNVVNDVETGRFLPVNVLLLNGKEINSIVSSFLSNWMSFLCQASG